MYSTSIRDNKCLVECIAVLDRVRVTKFIVDTGAMFTCCNCKVFDSRIDEDTLKKNETKILGGFVRGLPAIFYECRLKQFTIGNINMGRQVIMITNPYNQKVYFCKDAEDYEQNFQLKIE